MSDDLSLSWSQPKLADRIKSSKLEAPRSAHLPLKLPPKMRLGKMYRIVNSPRMVALVAALVLAVLSPIAATLITNQATSTATQASLTTAQIEYLVLVDATTGSDLLVLDQPETTLSLTDLPERVNLRPQIAGKAAQVTYTTSSGSQIVSTNAPFYLAPVAGWQPLPGTETLTLSVEAAPPNQDQVTFYTTKLTFVP